MMINIKEKIINIFELFKDLIKKYTATVFVVIITTLLISFGIDTDLDDEFLEVMFVFLISYFAGTFFTESIFNDVKLKSILYVVSGGISLFFAVYFNTFRNLPEFWQLFYVGYISILLLIAVYSILKKSGLSFEKYITKVFSNLFFTSIVYGILAMGISFICFIFIELLLDGDYDEIILRANILLFGLFYVIGWINAVSNVESKEVNVFIKNLIKFVFMTLIGISIVVIYLYILKIFITKEMPSNIIYRICAILFIFAFPVWNMFEAIDEKQSKIAKIFCYSFIPFLILEGYSLFLRIDSNGLTPIRYIGLLFIVFQIITIILNTFWNKKKLHKLILCGAVFVAILTMTPMTPSKISSLNQLKRLTYELRDGIKFTDLSDEAKAKVEGAYKYLKYGDYFYLVPEYIIQQESDILNYQQNVGSYGKYYYFNSNSNSKIKVTGFDYIIKVYVNKDYDGKYYITGNEFEEFTIEKEEIEAYVRNLINESKRKDYYDDTIYEPYVEWNGINLYLTEVNAYYDNITDELDTKYIEGYIFIND